MRCEPQPGGRALAAFLAALALLLANDWVLRPAGLLPAMLTGKLSDLAGMLVAPVVLAAVLARVGVAARTAARVAVGAVALAFALLKLWGAAALSFDWALSAAARGLDLPFAARTTLDPTDLLVLPVLAPAALVARSLATDQRLWRGAAVAAGALACTATSYSHFRVMPHWGYADGRLASTFAQPLDRGGVLIRLGRQSADGRFELDVQLTADTEPLAVELRGVEAELAGARVRAEPAPGAPGRLEAARATTAIARVYFAPSTSGWAAGARGTLIVPVETSGRLRPLQIPLSFEERVLSWSETNRRFFY